MISTLFPRLRHVNQPVHVIGPTFSTQNGILIILSSRMAFL